MPGLLVNSAATVLCAHGGSATPLVPNPVVRLSGEQAVWSIVPWLVAGCGNPPPPASNGPCAIGLWTGPGTTRVKSFGLPLSLWPAPSTTVLSGTPIEVTAGLQQRVFAT